MTRLEDMVAEVLGLPATDVDEDTGTATTSAWSSLRHLEIVVAVEREYGVRLTPRQARSCRSVRALRALLAETGVRA